MSAKRLQLPIEEQSPVALVRYNVISRVRCYFLTGVTNTVTAGMLG